MKVYKTEEGKQRIYETYDLLLASWGVPYEEADLRTAWGTTHVVMAGPAELPPLLLFHGVGDDSAIMWPYNIKALSACYRCVAVDALGGPGKSVPNGRYAKEFSALPWLRAVYAELGIERACIVGVSYGCYLVQLLLTEMPEKVVRAVGIAGMPAIPGRKVNKMRSMLRFLPEALFPTDKNCERLIRKLTGSNGKVFMENERIWEHWKLLLRQFNQQAMMSHEVAPIDPHKLMAQADKVLFLSGELETSADTAEAVRQAGYALEVFPDAGHALNHERSREVNERIVAFLQA